MGEMREIKRRAGASGQTKWWIIAAVVVVFLLTVGSLGSIYIDWLWFDSVSLDQVFITRFVSQVAVFAVAAVAFLIVYAINMAIAMRLASRYESLPKLEPWNSPPMVNRLLKIGVIVAGVILAIMVGSSFSSSWDVVLKFINPTSFGIVDPLFGQDISFFVFTLPMYGLLHSWFTLVVFLAIVASLVVYGIRLVLPQMAMTEISPQGQMTGVNLNLNFGRGIKAHLSVLIALLILGFAFRQWLDIYELVYKGSGLVFGAGYADVHASLPAMWVMVAVAVLFALLLLINIPRRGYKLIVTGLVLWVGVGIVGTGIYPGFVQNLEVLPSELDKERPYIEYNIDFTNKAYALDRITEVEYPAEEAVTAAEIDDNPGTIKNIRLWDPAPLLDTYNQIQSIRLYYDFLDVDVDRYMVDGEYRQVMLSARELSPSKLASQAQTWVNQRLQFTHGYGVAMSPVNEVTPEGLPQLFLQDVPPRGKVGLDRPEIYYGESTDDYVIVKTGTPEFDYPKGDENVYVQYQGESGVEVGSFARRLLFAWQFGDPNILLTESIEPESKVLYNRNIKQRAQKVAPFLAYDGDPYVVVANNRLYWMMDAYTYTDRYPYSQPMNVGGGANYLRNSVKVVMDAYDGNINFYLADDSDPIIHTYSAIFPDLFSPMSDMPDELRSHVRYPQDLFDVQSELYRTYHMKDPRVFYNKEDLWNIPTEVYIDKQQKMQPYYVIMRLPGEEQEEFALILPYTPPNKNNMITWLAGRSDGDNYGKLVAYKYPKDKLIFGPMQIEARIDQDPRISEQLSLWDQAGSRVIRGNMIVIPIGQSNLYVEPIYLQSDQTELPEMKRVILATGNRVVMEPTVNTSMQSLLGGQVVTEPTPTAPPVGEPTEPNKKLSEAAEALLDRFSELEQDLGSLKGELEGLLDAIENPQQ